MILISCGSNDHEPNGKTTPKPDVKPTETVTKYVGGDISLLPEYEKAEAIFKDKGTAVAPLVLFKKAGWNAMRLRLFVNPDQYKGADRDPNACQNLAYILPLAKQIKAAGFKLLLDFHYSDTWADPAKQWTPAAWAGLDDSQLAAKLKAYTAEVLTKMKQNGTEPDLIQTGNEISYGMLWGQNAATARYCYPSSSPENWNRFTQLLHAGRFAPKQRLFCTPNACQPPSNTTTPTIRHCSISISRCSWQRLITTSSASATILISMARWTNSTRPFRA